MSVSVPFIGPIDQGSAIMLVTIVQPNTPGFTGLEGITGNIPLYLTTSTKDSSVYYWEHEIVVNQKGIPVFNISGSYGRLSLRDTTNQTLIGYDDESHVLGRRLQSEVINFTQNLYAPWNPPTLLLTNVGYELQTPDAKTLKIYNDDTATATVDAKNIIAIPTSWYSFCSTNPTYNITNGPFPSLGAWMCAVDITNVSPNIPFCGLTGTYVNSGYTNYADCRNGIQYGYCSVSQNCGNKGLSGPNCNGPCSTIYDLCVPNSNNQFACVFDPSLYFKDEPWWKSTWFIVIIVSIFVLIFVIVVVIIAIAVNEKKKNNK